MRVRKNNGIDPVDAALNARESKFRRRIDQKANVAAANVSTAAATAIPRIDRGANLAPAADLRNPYARPRP